MVDITDFVDPEEIMNGILAKGKRLPIDKDSSKYLNAYFSRPQRVNLVKIGNKKVIFITEDAGMYTFNGSRIMLDKIATSLQKHARVNGYDASLNYVNYSDDPEHVEKINFLLE